ncbi:hypothetical protein Tco_0722656 [Tanacetum coccineum]|uniref:Uncharacterized protein n=1 Tax=Tanacetum coccineum TaxID=301880 RepID=A0ABQ4XQH6_9ASTR
MGVTSRSLKTEARMSREAWGRSMDASDLARAEVMSLRTTVLAQQSEIRDEETTDLDGGVTETTGTANGPAQPELPEEAGSSS